MPASFDTLKKRGSFVKLSKAGRRFVFKTFVLMAIPRSQLYEKNTHPLLVGFTATRKIGGAVQRNFCKRRLRAALHEVHKRAPFCADYAYVFIARSRLLECDYHLLIEHLEEAQQQTANL